VPGAWLIPGFVIYSRPAAEPGRRAGGGSGFFSRGTKKKTTDPCVYLINFQGTNQPQIFLAFFLVPFWAFLGEGSSKTRQNIFAKSPCRNNFRENSQKIDKNFNISFSSTFFVL
jgi:hypothetical protein